MAPPMGFIAVECFFTRPPGDAWHEETWSFPIIRRMAKGSEVGQIVTAGQYDQAFIDRFVEAGKELAAEGCVGILTSCGFLCMAQQELARRLPIPIATSSLIQLPSILALLPPTKSILILTFDATKLGPDHLTQLSIPSSQFPRIHIAGAPHGGSLQRLVKHNDRYDFAAIEAELVDQAKRMKALHPEIGGVLLECTQMAPFAEAVQQALGGLPVYDVSTMGEWFYSGLVRRKPAHWGKADSKI